MDRLEIGEATGARSMRQRFDVSGTSPGEAIRLPIQIVALHAARSFAADAHDCIMVRIRTDLPHTDPMQAGRETLVSRRLRPLS